MRLWLASSELRLGQWVSKGVSSASIPIWLDRLPVTTKDRAGIFLRFAAKQKSRCDRLAVAVAKYFFDLDPGATDRQNRCWRTKVWRVLIGSA